jgi:predicted anti-sigma-YlaC factor YlaD
MNTCNVVTRDLEKLAGLRPAELPEVVRDHVAACPACGRRLAAARLARGLVAAATEAASPPEGFADRVRTALAARKAGSRPEVDIWRPAWGLMPAFAAAVAALFIVYQTSEVPAQTGLLSTEGLSAGEYLVLGSPGPEMDDIVAVVLEGGGK